MENGDEFLVLGFVCVAIAAWALSVSQTTDTDVTDLTTPRGIRNNNPLNLKYIAADPYDGQTGADADGFGIYSSWQLGVRAGGLQLTKNYSAGATTVQALVTSWSTTDQTTYANYVAAQMGVAVAEPLAFPDQLTAYVMAAIHFENGENPYSSMDVQAALES